MRAADIVEALPTAQPGDAVLSAVQLVSRHGLPGLVVADERGTVIGCMSSVDLLWVALPRYLRDEPIMARVIDENHADRIATTLVDARIRDVLGEVAARIPVARPDATVVALAEVMARRCCPLVLIKAEGDALGVVTANRLLEVLVAATGDASR
jgi:CBS-domain-containing membrane protein